MFNSPEELEALLNNYFEEVPEDEWTWTGLALHIGTTKETLREYKEREDFVAPLKKALLRVENGYEKDLKKKGHSGSIFALKNFGWKDRQEIAHEVSQGFLNIDPFDDSADNSTKENTKP